MTAGLWNERVRERQSGSLRQEEVHGLRGSSQKRGVSDPGVLP
jgi:hypothetical protein